MPTDPSLPAVRFSDGSLYATLVQFPVACFAGALVSDLAYWRTALFMWETFSVWLLAAGCLMGALAGIVGLIWFLRDRRARAWRYAWPHAASSLLAFVLSIVNAFVHSRDGYTAVVPDGLTLSTIVVLLMLATAWMGWTRTDRSARIGVAA